MDLYNLRRLINKISVLIIVFGDFAKYLKKYDENIMIRIILRYIYKKNIKL